MSPSVPTGSATLIVGDEHLASHIGSGDVPVLATPWLVALCERATVLATADMLDTTDTSVGIRIEFDHLAPSHPGAEVVATATFDGGDERHLEFLVEAREGERIIGRGRIRRATVDRARFLGGTR
jgi:fluoroacetyl-CoA thioesterase